jgi:hypothetical protein
MYKESGPKKKMLGNQNQCHLFTLEIMLKDKILDHLNWIKGLAAEAKIEFKMHQNITNFDSEFKETKFYFEKRYDIDFLIDIHELIQNY